MYETTCPVCNKVKRTKQPPTSQLCRSCAKKLNTVNFKPKKCKFCGEEFIPTSNHQVYCKRVHYRICPVCGKYYVEDNVDNLKYPPVACSYECRTKLRTQTSLEKYGCIAPGNNEEARKKSKQTCLEHFGVPYAMQSKEVQQKSKETLLRKYGIDNIGKHKESVIKRLKTCELRYGNPQGPNLRCRSKVNDEISKYLEHRGVEHQREYRIENRIFDFKIDDTLVEINPSYTHSVLPSIYGDGLDKYYHRDKTLLAHRNGYKCINIWDWEDKDLILDSLTHLQTIDDADLAVYRLNKDVADEFLNRNHPYGTHRGQLLCLGLVKDDEIYQVMTFGKPTYSKSHYVQIYRMCTRLGYSIDGGYQKLSRAASEFGLYNIIAYCDLAKSNGSEYEDIGMKLIRKSPPRLIWSRGDQYINSSLIVSGRSTYHSDDELIQDNWLPIYDCGQSVYEF